ncbi:hypothetical protein [Rhizobium leguminosarum]|uniref:hypothetical protein n=1 Tax=Rhizobium leguminosarum TaxID=384 RepID=UPI0004A2E6E5|nr:hypothetical protein [Rhizobium leguminosarum]
MIDLSRPLSPKDWVTLDGRRLTREVGFHVDDSHGFSEMTSPVGMRARHDLFAQSRLPGNREKINPPTSTK